VEEKILALQERKRTLAAGTFEDGAGADGWFEALDLQHLLEQPE
jgi:SNF2 family DNA or RNA helicase